MSPNLALAFDIDDTLTRDTTTVLLEQLGIDVETFWKDQFPQRVQNGYDPTVASLSLLLEETTVTEADLEAAATQVEREYYPGIPGLFDDLRETVGQYPDIEIEFHIISEGIAGLIEHTALADGCTDVYASRLQYASDGELTDIKRPISFTDKTRYLYQIRKGIRSEVDVKNPYAVNKEVPESKEQVPFANMIYLGDGITDIPCFSLLKGRNGRVFGVREEPLSPKQEAVLALGSPKRAVNHNDPDYEQSGQLGSLLRLTVEGLCTNATIDQLEAL